MLSRIIGASLLIYFIRVIPKLPDPSLHWKDLLLCASLVIVLAFTSYLLCPPHKSNDNKETNDLEADNERD